MASQCLPACRGEGVGVGGVGYLACPLESPDNASPCVEGRSSTLCGGVLLAASSRSASAATSARGLLAASSRRARMATSAQGGVSLSEVARGN